MKSEACNIELILLRGGLERIRLLEYSVFSTKLDVLFIFLVDYYRMLPSASRAVAMYDSFCAPQSPCKLSELAFPPHPSLGNAIELLRKEILEFEQALAECPEEAIAPRTPGNWLFDATAAPLRQGAQLAEVAREFNPELAPEQCLPGGRMTPGQHAFVEYTWKPQIRPTLVQSGFPMLASLG